MTPWLHIIGFGEGDMPPIPPGAETIIGPQRAISRLLSSPAQRGRGTGEAGGGGGPKLNGTGERYHAKPAVGAPLPPAGDFESAAGKIAPVERF